MPTIDRNGARRSTHTAAIVSGLLVASSVANGCTAFLRSDDSKYGFGHADRERDADTPEGGAPAACDAIADPLYLKARAPVTSAWFGFGLAAQENTLAVLAPVEKNRAPVASGPVVQCPQSSRPSDIQGAGAVHLFERAASGWTQHDLPLENMENVLPMLPENLPGPLAFLNISTFQLALDGPELALGVGGDGTTPVYTGSVRLFRREGGVWGPEVLRIEARDPEPGALFGMSVALSGNLLAVGAPAEDRDREMNDDAGSVHLFELSPAGYTELGVLRAPTPEPSAWFGATMVLSDDWLVVGEPAADGTTPPDGKPDFAGSVYAFRRNGTRVSPTPVRVETRHIPFGGIGSVLALDGGSLFVGAPLTPGCSNESLSVYYDRTGHDPTGVVFEFELVDDRWQERGCFEPPPDERGVLFGLSLALTPRFLAVSYAGAKSLSRGIQRQGLPVPDDNGKEEYVGAVHLHPRDAGGHIAGDRYCVVKAPNAGSCDAFGNDVVATDEFLAIGAPTEDGNTSSESLPDEENGLLDSGALYVYPLSSAAVQNLP